MKKTAGSTNRTWLAIIGFILLAAGVLWAVTAGGLLAGAGEQWESSSRPLQNASTVLDAPWLASALIVVGVILMLFGLWWLIRQIPRSGGSSTFRFQKDPKRGFTLVEPKVITAAVAEHIEDLTYVTDAKAGLKGQRTNAELVLDVTVNERADLKEVTREIREEVLPSVARVLGNPLGSVGVVYTVSRQSRSKRQVTLQ
ncbi:MULTISPECIES: alkaline shock response membrane anchor protein AmaP [Micrococcaceae]|uniref:alkaline shock response membrane anchor protein AmaP n=1 Tax=unclassified Kocuria TaxID=2649579 RepID=UPI0010107D9D|nr:MULTISPECIES: alkaline shock response membrane anchor protein AmaP [unclassified Kocuria]